jgi:GNAT superfamily N-acetyltransferase
MARVRIRLARSSDCRALAEMRYRFRAETEPVTETKSRFMRRCTSWMRKRFRSGSYPWRCWVADDGKRLLGHVCVQLIEKIPNPVNEPELHAYLTNFYVIPEMRDQGLGKKLLNKALSWCRTREIDAVFCGLLSRAGRSIAGAAWLNLRISLRCDIALIGRTELGVVFVALYNRSAKHNSGVATEVGV